MRNPELMLELLREMSADPSGHVMAPLHMGMGADQQGRRHHVELLVDAGHAEWVVPSKGGRPSIARITNDGYDFLNAVENGEGVKAKFLDMFAKGTPYAKAAADALSMALKLGGG